MLSDERLLLLLDELLAAAPTPGRPGAFDASHVSLYAGRLTGRAMRDREYVGAMRAMRLVAGAFERLEQVPLVQAMATAMQHTVTALSSSVDVLSASVDAMTERLVSLEPIAQAAVDWCNDTGECHFCDFDAGAGKPHGERCPVPAGQRALRDATSV